MTAHMTWKEFWAWFGAMPERQKFDTLCLNFTEDQGFVQFVRQQTPETQIEVLKGAPRNMILTLAPILKGEARTKLLPKGHKV